jgi:serine/threonine protein kinase
MPLAPGTTLGSYQVTAKIGEGGMGEVYRARDTKLDRDVALKVLPQAFVPAVATRRQGNQPTPDDPDHLRGC